MNVEWMLIRGTGIVAYLLLATSTVWGLLLSTNLLGRAVKAKPLTWVHEALAIGALLATGAHLLFLWMDEYIEFGAADLFVPGASSWNPLAVAWGISAFYALFIVSASFYVKRWIGQAAWRTIHFLAFGSFAAAAIHGLTAGTDSGQPVVAAMYASTVTMVGLLVVLRAVRSGQHEAGRRAGRGVARSAATTAATDDKTEPAARAAAATDRPS